VINREQALLDLEHLAEIVGIKLSDVPVDKLDQWGAEVRDTMTGLEVPRLDEEASKAAFAGGYIVASMLVNASIGGIKADALTTISQLLQWLYKRGTPEGPGDAGDWESWLSMS
jgi:hypothetical protein